MLHATYKYASLVIAVLVGQFGIAGLAFAESDGRVALRLTNKWQAPGVEDLDSYLQTLPAPKGSGGETDKDKNGGSTQAAIVRVKKLLDAGVDKRNRQRLQQHLAELYFTAGLEQRRVELDAYNSALGVNFAAETSSAEPKADHNRSRLLFLKALDTYRTLLSVAPAYNSRGDIALSQGRLLALLESPNALPELKKIVADFGGSNVAERAQLELVEIYLKNGKKAAAEATNLLATLAKSKDAQIKAYAKYRAIWISLAGFKPLSGNVEGESVDGTNATAALAGMREIVAKECRLTKPSNQHLCKQATDDVVYLYANSQQVLAAESYFKGRRDKERYFLTLERAAWLYNQAKKTQEASSVLSKLIKDAPNRPAAARTYVQLADMLRQSGDAAGAAAAMENMAHECVASDGAWVRAQSKDQNLVADAKKLFRKKSADYATLYAKDYDKQSNSEYLSTSNRIFAAHLSVFPSGGGSDKLRFQYAEGLNKEQKPSEAAAQYLIVAKNVEPNSSLRIPAAERMLALELPVAGPEPEITPQQWAALRAPQPLAKSEVQLTAVIDQYGKIFPQRAGLSDLRLRAAAVYLAHGYATDARTRVETLVSGAPESKAAATAINMLLAYHNERREWDTTLKLSAAFFGQEQIKDTKLRASIREAWRLALWNKATDLNERKDKPASARTYSLFAETFPDDKQADLALVNASNLWLSQGNGPEGIKPCLKLASTYPNSTFRIPCLQSVGSVYEQRLEYTAAAEAYVQIAGGPADAKASEALLKAAELFKDDHNLDQSSIQLNQIIKTYPNTESAASALLKLAELDISRNDKESATSSYDKYVSQYSATHAEDAILAATSAAILVFQTNPNGARQRLDRAEALVVAAAPAAAPKARSLLAANRFGLARSGRERVPTGTIDESSLVAFTKSLQDIRAELKNAEGAYGGVIRLSDPEYSEAAHYQLGVLYEQAFNAVKVLPHSNMMSGDDLMAAINQREVLILELKTNMSSHWEQGYGIAQAGKRHDRWSRLSRAKLAQLSPKKYTDTGEIMLKPVFTSHVVNSAMTEDK